MLISPNTMCPALMFAASRNDRVNGRTIILVVSMIIKNGFNQSGAPSGRKCAIEAFVFLLNLDRINVNHIGNPIDMVKIKWLDKLNVYGIRPVRLIIIIDAKIGVINEPDPLRL